MSMSEIRRKRLLEGDQHILECTEPDCKHIGRPFIKMGGLICRECRIILKYPNSSEYKAYLKEMREKIEENT